MFFPIQTGRSLEGHESAQGFRITYSEKAHTSIRLYGGQSVETSGPGQCTIHNKPDYRNNVNRSPLEGAAKRQCTHLIP